MDMQLTVNRELRQQGNTSLMIYKLPRLIADISKYVTLYDGDLIYTGTPAGVGPCVVGDQIHAYLRKPGSEDNLLEINIKVEE